MTQVISDDRDSRDKVLALYTELREQHEELIRQMGDELSPFPSAGVDGFLSHFIMSIEFLQGDAAGTTVSMTMPPSAQSVARSAPFTYTGSGDQSVDLPIPDNCTLQDRITESDFLNRPEGFFTPGQQAVWMQILNLDARADTPDLGPIRIILGETVKAEYPDIFKPSLGVAESLGKSGFPARLFFNPYAIVETPVGAFRAIHGTLAYGRVTAFPPCGTAVSICACVPLEPVERVAGTSRVNETAKPVARLIALSHPIDVSMQVSGSEAFNLVERRISAGQERRVAPPVAGGILT